MAVQENTAAMAAVEDNVDVDLGYLTVYDREPLASLEEEYLRERAQRSVQMLFQKLHSLAKSQSKVASNVDLPKPVTDLPRQKPVPITKKPKTKWEEYAERKGIQKRKRDRMVWDEDTQAWKPRWGYKGVTDEQQDWAVELKDQDDPTVDKFIEKRQNKKVRVLKNRQKQLRNQERASNSKKNEPNIPSGVAVDVSKARGKRGKTRTQEAIVLAQKSTASLGRFDTYQKGEPKRKLQDSKRRKFAPAEKNNTKERDLKILERVLRANR